MVEDCQQVFCCYDLDYADKNQFKYALHHYLPPIQLDDDVLFRGGDDDTLPPAVALLQQPRDSAQPVGGIINIQKQHFFSTIQNKSNIMCIFAPAIGAKKCSMCHLKTANKQIDMYKENKNLNRIKVVLAEKSAKQVSGQADWPRPSHWDLGSGTRNILRYAPLYYPDYKIEINSSTQFLFSITSQDENVPNSRQISPTPDNCPRLRINVPDSGQMSPTEGGNVPNGEKMSKKNVKNVQDGRRKCPSDRKNVPDRG